MESPSEGRLIILILYLFLQQVTLLAGKKEILARYSIIIILLFPLKLFIMPQLARTI